MTVKQEMVYAYKDEISQMQCEKEYPNPKKREAVHFLANIETFIVIV